jgi:hypothetical protein
VVHATNAYSAALEPSLKGVIIPNPHICNRFAPPRALSGSKALQNSYGVLLPNGALFSINSRSSSDGSGMFRGSNPGQKKLDEWADQEPGRYVDDSLVNLRLVTREVRALVNTQFLDGSDADGVRARRRIPI